MSTDQGMGYYAEGARGSNGHNPDAGDRDAVERALKTPEDKCYGCGATRAEIRSHKKLWNSELLCHSASGRHRWIPWPQVNAVQVPSTEEVRYQYCYQDEQGPWGPEDGEEGRMLAAEFDAWIAEFEANIRAECAKVAYDHAGDQPINSTNDMAWSTWRAGRAIGDAITEGLPCTSHRPKQHRDFKPPWCSQCGLTADFTVPVSNHLTF